MAYPFNIYANDIEFDTNGVAVITCENRSCDTTWHVNCSPEQVCCLYKYISYIGSYDNYNYA